MCELVNTSLRRANLQETNLDGANLQKADLWAADLQGASLSARWLGQEQWTNPTNLQEAKLGWASLENATLWRANLQGADLDSVRAREADFRKANLQGAILRSANLLGADLTGADLRSANLHNADIRLAMLSFRDLERKGTSGGGNINLDEYATKFDENTTLPDGSKWRPGVNMAYFTDPSYNKAFYEGFYHHPDANEVILTMRYPRLKSLPLPELLLEALQRLPETGPIRQSRDKHALNAISRLCKKMPNWEPQKRQIYHLLKDAFSRWQKHEPTP